jgi:hypothetical protein
VAVADAFLIAGYVIAFAGCWLQFGPGWALILGGTVLFVAGGLSLPRARR